MTPEQQKVKDGIEYLKKYFGTYDNQRGYLDYGSETLLKDFLYGIGVAIDPKRYKYADGFRVWLDDLKKILDKWELDNRETRRTIESC